MEKTNFILGGVKLKKVLSAVLAGAMVLSLAACSSKTNSSSKSTSSGSSTGTSSEAKALTFDNLNLGTDYTGIKANLVFHTHRTDIVNTTFKQYIADFQKLYPNINIKYEADTNYSDAMTTRLTTSNWGDICMIPTSVQKSQLSSHFITFGDLSTLQNTYQFLNNFAYQGQVYGIPSTNNVQGVLYNKAVFTKAGITSTPKTPDEFIGDLKLIKQKTSAIPLYTNFAAGWTMGAWDAYIGGSATGSADAMNNLPHAKNPFAKPSDGTETGPYYVYKVLYDAVSQKLTEADPTTTDWESSKAKFNNGEIATMVLGSWAIVQMQSAGAHADDVGYMPFPITVGGKQYASAGPDYCYGINKNASKDNQIAAMLYIKWLVDKSNFDTDQGGLPVNKTHSLPKTLNAFSDTTFVVDNPAPAGEEDLFSNVNKASGISLNADNTHVQTIVQDALQGKPSFDSILDGWNQKWTAAEKQYNSLK